MKCDMCKYHHSNFNSNGEFFPQNRGVAEQATLKCYRWVDDIVNSYSRRNNSECCGDFTMLSVMDIMQART